MAPPFQIGDRVVTKKTFPALPAGSSSTVILVFLSAPDYYDIRFDGSAVPYVMHRADLERLSAVGTDEDGAAGA